MKRNNSLGMKSQGSTEIKEAEETCIKYCHNFLPVSKESSWNLWDLVQGVGKMQKQKGYCTETAYTRTDVASIILS